MGVVIGVWLRRSSKHKLEHHFASHLGNILLIADVQLNIILDEKPPEILIIIILIVSHSHSPHDPIQELWGFKWNIIGYSTFHQNPVLNEATPLRSEHAPFLPLE